MNEIRGFRDLGRFLPPTGQEEERAETVTRYYDKRDELKYRKEDLDQIETALENAMHIDRKIRRCMEILIRKQDELNRVLENEVDGLYAELYERGAV